MAKNVNTTKSIIERFHKIHGDKYDYSKFAYIKMHEKSIIICPEHGEFMQSAHAHLKGQGCPKCAHLARAAKQKYTIEQFIERANQVHHNKYDYSKTEYTNSHNKVCIICPEHGEFWQKADSHMNGQGCPLCYNEKRKTIFNYTNDQFITKASQVHSNKYDYSKVKYENNRTKVCIICPEHGEFWQSPTTHLRGQGCPKCGIKISSKKRMLTNEEFVNKAIAKHGDKYDYSSTEYHDCQHKITINCNEHGEFEQYPSYHLDGCGCPKCAQSSHTSQYEQEIFDYIQSLDIKCEKNNREILSPIEIDIYCPEQKVGIEFDGLYWHNEINQPDKNYHLNKTTCAEEQDIHLIHIFEDEWIYKQDIVKSRLKNVLGITSNRIFARKCKIKEVEFKESKEFLVQNHIQGNVNSKYRYGLYYNNELVSLMTFGNLRKNLNSHAAEDTYEMLRFCNKLDTTVIGGAGKLLNQFKKVMKPKRIISYADRRWSMGNLYSQLGFTFLRNSQPSYFYVINDKRRNRFAFRKDKLISDGFDPNKTEHEIMLERKIYRIYDCGTMVFEKNYND